MKQLIMKFQEWNLNSMNYILIKSLYSFEKILYSNQMNNYVSDMESLYILTEKRK